MFQSQPSAKPAFGGNATGKKQNVSRHRPYTVHHAVRPRGDLLRGFAARTAVAEQLPVRTFRTDLDGTPAFIFAIVPFDEITIDSSRRSEAGEFTRASGALQWASPHLSEVHSTQPLSKSSGIAFTALG